MGKTAPGARPRASKPGFFLGTPAAPMAIISAILNPGPLSFDRISFPAFQELRPAGIFTSRSRSLRTASTLPGSDLETGTFPVNPVLFNGYPGNCKDLRRQEQSHARVLSHTAFKDSRFCPGSTPTPSSSKTSENPLSEIFEYIVMVVILSPYLTALSTRL